MIVILAGGGGEEINLWSCREHLEVLQDMHPLHVGNQQGTSYYKTTHNSVTSSFPLCAGLSISHRGGVA